MVEIVTKEPSSECQRELIRALRTLAAGGGTESGTIRWLPLRTRLDATQWDRCWWNTRWWARNEDKVAYELIRAAGKGCPVVLENGAARVELDIRYPARAQTALGVREEAPFVSVGSSRADTSFATWSGEDEEVPAPDLEAEPLTVPAIRFAQNDRVFYAAVMPAGELLVRSKVDVWSADVPDEEAGYQRAPMRTRLRDVAAYVERDDAILPVGGLMNARAASPGTYGEVLQFTSADEGREASDAGITTGWLTIATEVLPLYIVDMQHRLLGIARAINEDGRDDLTRFPMLVTIADGLSKVEEVEQFELINTMQKRVRTDLARRLMAIQTQDLERQLEYDRKGRLWEARGPVVADWLNRQGAVWKERILPPNKSKKDMPDAVMRETSFVTSLKPILQTPYFQRRTEERVAIDLDAYWQAIADIFPEAFESPFDYVIQKTPGVYSLHAVFPEVVEVVRSQEKELNKEQFRRATTQWEDLGSDYWASWNTDGASQFGSAKGFARLAATLRSLLPKVED
jgi:DGQHR domain-containing protein